MFVSFLILGLGIFLTAFLLSKQQNARKKEVGLLFALGYSKEEIRKMILFENSLLSVLTALMTSILFIFTRLGILQLLICLIISMVSIFVLSIISSQKILNLEPHEALRQ